MPNTREKLIELIRDGRYKAENICNDNDDCQRCTIADPYGNCKIGYIADHLIANGVTVQQWIPVTERLPEEDGWYLVYTTPNREHKSINKARFCKGFEWDNFTPRWCGAGGHWANVTHWMPLPEPPKGE